MTTPPPPANTKSATSHSIRRIWGACLMLTLLATLTVGCSNRLQAERDALYQQNVELQEELNRARAAADASRSGESSLQSRIAQLQAELAAAQRPAAPTGRTGFESISGVTTTQTAGSIMVRVPGDVLFDAGKIELKQGSRSTLNQIANVIKDRYPSNAVRVEGYTDTDPIRRSKWKDNLELSLQRAATVHRYLQTRGLDSEQIYAAGFGPAKPQSTKAQSRRVEIVVIRQP